MKKQGFTLIELLAVIVILAIIALIAVPIILDLIGNTKVSAAKRSAENYIDAVELYLARSELDKNKVTLDRNNKYNVTSSTLIGEKNYPLLNYLIEISGRKPTGIDDYVQLDEKGKVIDAQLTMNGYKVEIKDGKIVGVIPSEKIEIKTMELNYTEQTMEKGSTFKLIPIFTPIDASNQEVEYISSDESVVSVDDKGNVIAVNTGSAKIIVTSKDDSSKKAECNIIVVLTATGLELTPVNPTIGLGLNIQLEGTITPSDTTTNSLEWKSSNADIASVDSNGLVTGVSIGEVIITATTVNGIEATSSVKIIENKPSVPELYSGLTPVVYSNNSWKVANTSSKWYDYKNQEWANAVILKSGVTKNVGDTINISNEVQGMFVWIPRYEYRIEGDYGKGGTSKTSLGEIEIYFMPKDVTNATKGYIMHPGFKFGDIELNGIWLAKFETTGPADLPTVLPNVTSLRSQNISTQFATSQKFRTFLSNSDPHMTKNSEWATAVYLTQSKYGKYGNSNYTGENKEVFINNCTSFTTGISGDTVNAEASNASCTINTYETVKGQAASTTGNITGIYDMSGGAFEHVMGVYNSNLGNSGFAQLPDSKYYDNYMTTQESTACNGICYGHSLNETNTWNSDSHSFVSTSNNWLGRSGHHYDKLWAGIFYAYAFSGGSNSYAAFRIAITSSN